MRESGNQIEAEIGETRGAQNFRGLENIGAAMHPSRGAQFCVVEGLDAHADAVESRFPPRSCFFGGDGFRIGFERHFLELRRKRGADRRDDLRQARGFKKAGRSAAEIYRVDDGLRNVRDLIFVEQAREFGDLTANRLTYGAYNSFENTPVWKLQ